jgi:hypothetical protein
MKIKTKTLLDILDHLKFVFMSNNYIEDSNYIYFNTHQGVIWAYSDTLIYRHKYVGSLADDFEIIDEEIAIPAKELFTLIKKIKKEEINVKQVGTTFCVRNGRSSNTFAISDRMSDIKKLEIELTSNNILPANLDYLFKTYCMYDKNDKSCKNIIFENGYVVSSDRYNITRMEFNDEDFSGRFAIRWDILKHVLDNAFTKYGCSEDILSFSKDNYELICRNDINNIFGYEDYMESANEDMDYGYSIYMNKEEDIDFIDSFLLDYKTLDKKVLVDIISSHRLLILAKGNDGTQETKASITLEKYNAGEAEQFEINVDYMKLLYEKFDYFNVLDRMLYCCNVEDSIERIIVIKNLGD